MTNINEDTLDDLYDLTKYKQNNVFDTPLPISGAPMIMIKEDTIKTSSLGNQHTIPRMVKSPSLNTMMVTNSPNITVDISSQSTRSEKNKRDPTSNRGKYTISLYFCPATKVAMFNDQDLDEEKDLELDLDDGV